MTHKDLELVADPESVSKLKEKASGKAEVVDESKKEDYVHLTLRFKSPEDFHEFCENCSDLFEPKMSDPPEDYESHLDKTD